MSQQIVAKHFRLWLQTGMAGCFFAKKLAAKANSLSIEVHVETGFPKTDWIDSTFDDNGDADRAVIAVFPRILSEQALVDLLNSIVRERWRIRRRKKPSPSGGLLVGVDWMTRNGDVSETMGFAPFPHHACIS